MDIVKFNADKITDRLLTGIKKAVRESAVMMQDAAKSHCPTNTGELKNSIVISIEEKTNNYNAFIGTNKEYASYVEFGTGPVGKAHKGELPSDIADKLTYRDSGWFIHSYFTNGAKPHPFLTKAYTECKDTVIDNIKQAINESIK